MSSGPRTPGPRHMAGGAHRAGPAPVRASHADLVEVPPARVKRSRLAFALSVTVAALPVLVLDNLPASAERTERTSLAAVADEPAESAPPTSTPVAPTTTGAPQPSEAATAATLTAAPTTTVAPTSTTTTAPPVRKVAVRAPTTTAPPSPPPAAAPAPSSGRGDPNDPASWDQMAQCESGGNWAINTGNGYYGGLQFSLPTWQSYGGTGYPHQASKATQIAIGKKLQAAKGWSAWPGCARQLGFT